MFRKIIFCNSNVSLFQLIIFSLLHTVHDGAIVSCSIVKYICPIALLRVLTFSVLPASGLVVVVLTFHKTTKQFIQSPPTRKNSVKTATNFFSLAQEQHYVRAVEGESNGKKKVHVPAGCHFCIAPKCIQYTPSALHSQCIVCFIRLAIEKNNREVVLPGGCADGWLGQQQ